jgi:hypothetical protein
MSDVYFFKNKFDQLLKDNQGEYDRYKVTGLIELLKKMALVIDEEIELLKKKQKLTDF